MNRKQLAILLVLVVVLGGAGLVVYNKQKDSWSSGAVAGQKLAGDLPVNDVARIVIKHGANELNLVRTDTGWVVRERHDYPADFARISEMLLKLRELKIVRNEKVGPSQLPRLQLATPGDGTNAPVTVEFRSETNGVFKTLFLGRKHMNTRDAGQFGVEGGFPDGRYVRAGSDSDRVALIADPLDELEPDAASWLDKDFFQVEKPRSIEVAFSETTNSWQLTRESESADWQLQNARKGEEADPVKTGSLASPFSSVSFADVLAKGGVTETPEATVTIRTFDDFTYRVWVGAETNGNRKLTLNVDATIPSERAPGPDEKAEDKERLDREHAERRSKLEQKLGKERALQNWIYLVPSWNVEPLLKPRSELLALEGEQPPAESATPSTVPDPHAGHQH